MSRLSRDHCLQTNLHFVRTLTRPALNSFLRIRCNPINSRFNSKTRTTVQYLPAEMHLSPFVLRTVTAMSILLKITKKNTTDIRDLSRARHVRPFVPPTSFFSRVLGKGPPSSNGKDEPLRSKLEGLIPVECSRSRKRKKILFYSREHFNHPQKQMCRESLRDQVRCINFFSYSSPRRDVQ